MDRAYPIFLGNIFVIITLSKSTSKKYMYAENGKNPLSVVPDLNPYILETSTWICLCTNPPTLGGVLDGCRRRRG